MGRQFDQRVSERAPSARQGRAAGRASGPHAEIRRLQRTIGNRAVGRYLHSQQQPTRRLQRNGKGKVNLVDPAKASWVFNKTGKAWNDYDKWMADFLFVQRCMLEPQLYLPALRALDEKVMKDRQKTEARNDPAQLERVLREMERKHNINLQGAPIYTRTLSAEVFGEMSKQAVVATDPGAGSRHGAYTHRIQWWVVLTYADQLIHKPAELVKKAIDADVTPPVANWPQEMETEGGPMPLAENRGAIWDALFDRTVPQVAKELYKTSELGISHPELFTGEIVNGNIPELDYVSGIIRAQVEANWGGGGNAADAERTEAAFSPVTHRQHKPGVYFLV